MVTPDANLLVYAYDQRSRQHISARTWVETALTDTKPIGIAWSVILAFLRITTHPRLAAPMSMQEAAAIVDSWLSRPHVTILATGERHWAILRELLAKAQVRGNLTSDAHLAALAIEHGATLATNDRDYSRFEGLRVSYPLAD